MQIPSVDPTAYCRLCFTQQQLRWLLQSSDNPVVAQIKTCLGVALTPDVDYPCAVCRLCWAALETFEALRDRARSCDEVLRNSRMRVEPPPTPVDSDAVECKQECASPAPPEFVIEEVTSVGAEEPRVNEGVVNGSDGTTRDGSNTIMVGDIKVELLNVRSQCHSATSTGAATQSKEKPTNIPSFECQVCKKRFVKKTDLHKHIDLKKHSEPETVAARRPQKRPGEFKPISPKDIRRQLNLYSGSPNEAYYSCNMCHARYTQWQSFLRHRRKHESEGGTGGQAGSSDRDMASS